MSMLDKNIYLTLNHCHHSIIRAFRGLSGTYNVRANERDRATPSNIECLVQFLDNTQHTFVLNRRSKGQCLLDCVFRHLNLIETDFFGLKYLPQESHVRNLHLFDHHLNSSNTIATSTRRLHHNNSNNNNHHHSTRDQYPPLLPSPPPSKSSQPHPQSIIAGQHNKIQQLLEQQQTIKGGNFLTNNKTQIFNSYDRSPSSNASLSSSSTNNITTLTSSTLNHLNSHNDFANNLQRYDSPATSTTVVSTNNHPIAINNISNNSNCGSNSSINNNHAVSIHKCNNITQSCDSLQQQLHQSKSINNNNGTTATNNNNNNDDIFASTTVEERWLDPTKSIRKQYKSGPPYKFYFRVKFYVSDPCKLADDTTRNHLYLQLRQDILNNRLIVPTCSAILLASYILQSEVGDYKHELLEENYASNFKLLPNQNDDIKKKVIELHKQHKSLSPADAEYQFLEHAAKKLECYGVDLYEARDISKTNVQIGVSSNGIVIFRDNKRTNQFSWAKITKIMFKKKIFSIELRRDEGEICDNFIEYNLLTNQACKSFWEECVAQHSFFRLHQPKSPPKKFFSFLNFSSKFQYNGKTEYQTMEESRKRSFSHFSRTLSKRYVRRTLPIGRPPWIETSNREDSQSCSKEKPAYQANQNGVKNETQSCKGSQDSLSAQSETLAKSISAIKKSLEKGEMIAEFEKLSRKNEDEPLEESKSMENIDKNRYRDILPYDSTRVQLIDSMTGDYINASFVDMTVPSGLVNRYIATQGPLQSTCDDFWQMVWEQNCSLIIMVTPLVEAGRVKCHKYWPDEKEEVRYGQIFVRNISEKSKTATIDRTIQLVDCKVSVKSVCSDRVSLQEIKLILVTRHEIERRETCLHPNTIQSMAGS